jgi:hypothetical protein
MSSNESVPFVPYDPRVLVEQERSLDLFTRMSTVNERRLNYGLSFDDAVVELTQFASVMGTAVEALARQYPHTATYESRNIHSGATRSESGLGAYKAWLTGRDSFEYTSDLMVSPRVESPRSIFLGVHSQPGSEHVSVARRSMDGLGDIHRIGFLSIRHKQSGDNFGEEMVTSAKDEYLHAAHQREMTTLQYMHLPFQNDHDQFMYRPLAASVADIRSTQGPDAARIYTEYGSLGLFRYSLHRLSALALRSIKGA